MTVKIAVVSMMIIMSILCGADKDKKKKEIPRFEYSADVLNIKDGQYTIQFKIWEHKDGKINPDVTLSSPKVTVQKDNEAVIEMADEAKGFKLKCTVIVKENDKKKEVAVTTMSITEGGVEIFKETQLIFVK